MVKYEAQNVVRAWRRARVREEVSTILIQASPEQQWAETLTRVKLEFKMVNSLLHHAIVIARFPLQRLSDGIIGMYV